MNFLVFSLQNASQKCEVLIRPESINAMHPYSDGTAIYLQGRDNPLLIEETVDFVLNAIQSKPKGYNLY